MALVLLERDIGVAVELPLPLAEARRPVCGVVEDGR
jgi:hypothetical protein